MRSVVIGSALLTLLLLQGCGEKEAEKSTASPPAASSAPAPAAPAAGAPAAGQEASGAAPATGDARAVQQEGGSTTPLPAPPAPLAAPASGATASGTLLKESELKERPFIDAATLAKLPAQAKVTIFERSSGWYRVQGQGKSGWVRMLNVKVGEGAAALTGGSDLQQASALATGRAGSGNVVSTSGLRGLDEEKLSSAKPDYAQFDKLDSYQVSKEAARTYAQQNGLKSRSLSYLPAPK